MRAAWSEAWSEVYKVERGVPNKINLRRFRIEEEFQRQRMKCIDTPRRVMGHEDDD